jgi:hypothetical protein
VQSRLLPAVAARKYATILSCPPGQHQPCWPGGIPHLFRTSASAPLIVHIAHATAQAEHQAQSRPLPAVTCRKCAAILQLPSGQNRPLLDRWATSPILDRSLDTANSVHRLIIRCGRLPTAPRQSSACRRASGTPVPNQLLPTVAVRRRAAILQLPHGKEPPRAEEHFLLQP